MRAKRAAKRAGSACGTARTAGRVLAWLLLIGPGAAAAADEIVWRRVVCNDLSALVEPVFSCGERGLYYTFSATNGSLPPPPPGCSIAEQLPENPRAYPPPADPKDGEKYPCSDRSCLWGHALWASEAFAPPYVAVVDWLDRHGLTVSALIRDVAEAQVQVALFDLQEPLVGFAPEGVTDLQVLGRLCEVLELAEGGMPPSALNMSFGRLPEPAGPGLQDEIGAVLDLLAQQHEVALIAAAGNHGALLFPGTHPEVTAVGALALSTFRSSGGKLGTVSWETAPQVTALFPGNGLCMPFACGGQTCDWRAPAGSSYSSAFFTGWFSLAATRGLVDHQDLAGSWHPWREGSLYQLAHDGVPLPESVSDFASELFDRMHDPQDPCWQHYAEITTKSVGICSNGTCNWGTSLPPSHDELIFSTHHGSPSENPCVPCGGSPSQSNATSSSLTINLSATDALVEDGITIRALKLRVDGQEHLLGPSSGLKQKLEQGKVDQLVIEGVSVPDDSSVSLIFKLRRGPGEKYWTSVPVHLLVP